MSRRLKRVAALVVAVVMGMAVQPVRAASYWLGKGEDSSVAANWSSGQALLNNNNFYIYDTQMMSDAYRRKMKLGADKTGSKGNGIFFQAGSESDPFIVDGNGKTLAMQWHSAVNTSSGKIFVGAGSVSGGVVLNGGTYKPTGIVLGMNLNYISYLKLDKGAALETVSTNGTTGGKAYHNCIQYGKLVIDGGSTVEFGKYASASGAYLFVGGGENVAVSGAHGECYVLDGTLVNGKGILIGHFGESSDGTGYAYMEVDGGLVTNKASNVDIGETGTPGDRSILRIKSGTFAANGPLRIGRGSSGTLFMDGGVLDVSRDCITMASYNAESGEDCTLVMSNGVVKTRMLQYGSGAANATVLFDGGTLQAAQSGTLIAAHDLLSVFVGPRGGIIDANGKNATIESAISGTGGMTFDGSGTVTISADQFYTGATTIKSGTTLSATGRAFTGAIAFEPGAAVLAPSIPEGKCSVAVLTAASYSGVESLPRDANGNRFFVSGGQLKFGCSGLIIIVE